MHARHSRPCIGRFSGGLVRACHDLSEGGLAVAAAEMAFAGGLGHSMDVDAIAAVHGAAGPVVALFSESNTRFLCEVAADKAAEFERDVRPTAVGENWRSGGGRSVGNCGRRSDVD